MTCLFLLPFEKLTAVVRMLFYCWNWSTSHSHASKTTDSAVREKKLVSIPRRVRGTKKGKVDCNLVQDLSTLEHLCVLTCSTWLEILIHLIGAIGIELIAALHPVFFHACGYRFNVHFILGSFTFAQPFGKIFPVAENGSSWSWNVVRKFIHQPDCQ